MRYYVKVADAVAGVGFTRGYWTRDKAERIAEGMRPEYGPAVWIYTRRELRDYVKWSR